MRKKIILATVLMVTTYATAAVGPPDSVTALQKGMPSDVVKLINRIVACNHWSGEEAYDAERQRDIEDALRESRCDQLKRDETSIRDKYRRNKKVEKALDGANELYL